MVAGRAGCPYHAPPENAVEFNTFRICIPCLLRWCRNPQHPIALVLPHEMAADHLARVLIALIGNRHIPGIGMAVPCLESSRSCGRTQDGGGRPGGAEFRGADSACHDHTAD